MEPVKPTITHPTAEWTHITSAGVQTTLRVNNHPTMPETPAKPVTLAADEPHPPKPRHPLPNRYVITIHEGDAGATEAETIMTLAEAKALHTMLGDALAWDGQ